MKAELLFHMLYKSQFTVDHSTRICKEHWGKIKEEPSKIWISKVSSMLQCH